jgi:hypothetical protein
MLFFKRGLVLLVLLAGFSCQKNYLYVQQEVVDHSSLASFAVQSPDPRLNEPYHGQKILISWDFPKSQFEKKLSMKLTVRFWDNEEQEFVFPVDKKRYYTSYFFSNPLKDKNKKILTYKIDVFSEKNELIQEWQHQFWTKLIKIDSVQE